MERNFTEFVTRHGALINELSAFPTEKRFFRHFTHVSPRGCSVVVFLSLGESRLTSRLARRRSLQCTTTETAIGCAASSTASGRRELLCDLPANRAGTQLRSL